MASPTEPAALRGGVLWSADYKASTTRRGRGQDQKIGGGSARVAPARIPRDTTTKTAVVGVSEWPHDATTVMLRNIPSRYTQEDLLDELNSKGFYATFDYFHLMMDIHSRRNKGFAFLNMRSPALAVQIHAAFDGFQLVRYRTRQKVLEVALAEVQGLHANAISYLNVHRDRVQNAWFKPIIFVHAPDQVPDWKAIPLSESNLPEDIARLYGSHPTKPEQRQWIASQMEGKAETASPHPSEDSTTADELLMDGEYDEITSQVNSFLATCGGDTNHSAESLLAALDRPQRKHRAKRGSTINDRIHEGLESETCSDAVQHTTSSHDQNMSSRWPRSDIRTIEIAMLLASESQMIGTSRSDTSDFSAEAFRSHIPQLGFRAPPGLASENMASLWP